MKQLIPVPKQRKIFSRTIVVALVVGFLWLPTMSHAGPAMYWWHKPFSGTQLQCVKKARHIMPGHDEKPNGAFHSTDHITAVIKCIDYEKKPLAVLIVTGNSKDKTKTYFSALKKRMFD
tara:strand:- start:182 stop:538 length:357 start_codon:yes stop_codon:yes gene_type:complete